MSYSAGLLNVQTLNVPGASGGITATSINVAGTVTTNTLSSATFGSASLNVSGATTLNTLSASGATRVGGSLDVSGNSTFAGTNIKGNLTLGTNSVVRSDGSGNFVVNGNVLATGSLVTAYNPSYPPLNAASSWEGIWDWNDILFNATLNGNWYNYMGKIAIVAQPNNTYTLYTNSTGNGVYIGSQNMDVFSQYQPFKLLATNVVPVFTTDSSGITENSISVPFGYVNRSFFPASSILVTRLLTVAETGSNYAYFKSRSTSVYYATTRVLLPTDVTPVAGADWFSAYQTNYNEIRQENKSHVEVFDDIEGTYNQFRDTTILGNFLTDKATDLTTGIKQVYNPVSPSAFVVENKFKKLKTDADVYNLNINYIHRGAYAKPNVMTLHYDWKVYNQGTPLISPVQEITLINTSSPGSPVIGTIPSSFKFLTSVTERSAIKQNYSGVQEPSQWFMDNFIGIRLPLQVVGDKVLTITTTGPTGDYDVIPGVYTVTIPSGYYYPHSLATYVTQNINPDSGLRLGFHTETKNFINNQTYLESSGSSFYYLSSGLKGIASVSVTCSDSTFLTDVLGLNTLSTAQNPNPAPISAFVFNDTFQPRGGFPKYTYNGHSVNPDNLWTPQSVPSCPPNSSGLYQLSVSIGNVLTSDNPRDYYNTVFYFMNLFQQEEHLLSRYVPVLQDIDQEFYLPDTWEEAQYKLANLNAPYIMNRFSPALAIATNGLSLGTQSNKLYNISFNGFPGFSTTIPSQGTSNISFLINNTYESSTTSEKLLKPTFFNNSNLDNNGYTFTNYMDLSNCYVLAVKFDSSGATDFRTQSMSSYWMNKYNGSNGGLPADVMTTGNVVVPYNKLSDVSSNLAYGINQAHGHIFGIMKQSVANAILPPDASGSVVGYIQHGTYVYYWGNSNWRDAIVSLFKSKGVKYCVVDQRNNPGGGWQQRLTPFGLDPNFVWAKLPHTLLMNSFGAPNESQYYIAGCTFIADILKNPSKYPPSWRFTLDSSGLILPRTGNAIDNALYIKTGNPMDLLSRTDNVIIAGDTTTVDGSNNGQGIFNFTMMDSNYSTSAAKFAITQIKGLSGTSEHPQWNCTNPENPTVNYTTYGVFNRQFFQSDNSYTPDYEYTDNVPPGSDGSLDNNIFYNAQTVINFGARLDSSGVFLQSFNNPVNTMDAVSNYTPLTLMSEIGVYYDASGNQQAYLDGSYNAFRVSNNNTASYRDFRLERAVQCAYSRRAGCRSQSKFGYMPVNSADPYNWAVTDTSGALPLPVNPFGL